MKAPEFKYKEGYTGAFCDEDATEDVPHRKGARIVKAKSDPGDTTPTGTLGTVLGSVFAPDLGYAYFIEWDDMPRVAVFAVAYKLAAA